MKFKLLTLGELSLRRPDGEAVADSMRKPLLLLAVLAVEAPSAVSRERIAQLLWPASSLDRARQALNQALYSLRRECIATPVVGTTLLQLAPSVASDIAELRRAIVAKEVDAALALGSRPFLEGIAVQDGAEFDHWVDAVRRDFDQALTSLLRTTARGASAEDPLTFVQRWRQYGERCLTDPLIVRDAAAKIAGVGNRAAAVQLLQRHIDVMEREFELGVDRETATLMVSLRGTLVRNGPMEPLGAADTARSDALRSDLKRSTDDSRDSEVTEVGALAEEIEAEQTPPETAPRPWYGRLVGTVALAVAAFITFVAARGLSPSHDESEPHLLVAPFRVTGDTIFDYLGTGISEEIASRLAILPGLTLYPPSVLYGVQGTTALAQAKRLDADYLLEGTIQTERHGGRSTARVVSWLVSTETGKVLWTWSADRELAGMLGLQREIADSTARRVSIVVSASARQLIAALPTTDPTAYDLYLRALQYLRSGRDGLPEARDLLRQVVSLDSGFAVALARLGEVQSRMNWYGYDRDAGRMQEARRLIDRSHRLAPGQPEPHLAMAQWWLADRRAYATAAAELDTALRFAPANVDALMTRANISRRMGRWEASAADYREAGRLDPSAYYVHLEHGNTLLLMRRFGEARSALQRARQLSPDAVDPVVWLAALEVREDGDTLRAQQLLQAAVERVNAHSLVARVAQSFPELVRLLPPATRSTVSEFSLRDAYGDTALLHVLRSNAPHSEYQRRSHLDSAASILVKRIAAEPTAFAAFRALARVRLAQGRPNEAVQAARTSLALMPRALDAHAAMQALAVLAEAELAAGNRDSANVHIRQLLEQPSVLTAAILATDPVWRQEKPTAR